MRLTTNSITDRRSMTPLILMAACIVLQAANAMALTYGATAANGDFMYDIYNFVYMATTGAPAYGICILGICVAGYMLWKSQIVACFGVFVALLCIIKCNSILNSMGYCFN